jgi:outer membrane receptor for ferrienterochelin and colicins
VAVLQDGLPMVGARGIKSGNPNLNRQSTGRLERVEVVKGAASSLFGSDAIGGVINMISRPDLIPTSTTTLQLREYSARYDENSRLESLGAPAPAALANLNQRYRRLDGTISQQLSSRNFLQGGYEWVQDNYKGANRLV